MVNRKLGRTSSHRNAMFRNQLSSLIDKERIITTLPKAKELRPQIERLVTIGKTDNVHNRRQVFRVLGQRQPHGPIDDVRHRVVRRGRLEPEGAVDVRVEINGGAFCRHAGKFSALAS